MKRQNKKLLITWKQWGVVTVLMCLMVGLAIFVYVADRVGVTRYSAADKNSTSAVVTPGETVCLPHRGSGPVTEECAIGLKDKDGYFYALKNTTITEVGKKLEVEGVLTEATGDESYDIAGTIDVTKTTDAR